MDGSHPIRITREGDHEVVHLPSGIAVPAHAVMRQDGERLIIESAPASSQKQRLLDRLSTLEAIEDDFAPIENLPASPVRF